MKDYKEDFVREVGMVAAIMSDNFLDRLVAEQGEGRMEAYDTIGLWAFQFQNAYDDITDWEEYLADSKEATCWEDFICHFAFQKLEKIKR